MTNKFEQFDSSLCDKLFNFIYPDERNMTEEDVQAELQRLRIDTTDSMNKIRTALQMGIQPKNDYYSALDDVSDHEMLSMFEQLQAELETKDKEIERLKEALERYGNCLSSCACRWTSKDPKWHPCDCGFKQTFGSEVKNE